MLLQIETKIEPDLGLSEYWDGPAPTHRKNSARGLGQTLRPALRPEDDTPTRPPPPLLQPKCQVEDRVRLDKKHRPLKKGYLPGWTEEVLVVTHIRRHPVVTYGLFERDGTPIKGTCKLQSTQHE